MPRWEVFDKRAAVSTKSPMVTIQRKGLLSLNRAAVEALGQPDTVELLFDAEENMVGLRPAEPTSPRSYPLRSQSNGSTYLVAGTAFTNHYGIDTSVARRYAASMIGPVLAVDLKQDAAIVTGPRARPKRPGRNSESGLDNLLL